MNNFFDIVADLVQVDRRRDYDHPLDCCSRIAKTWEAVLGIDITPEQVALCLAGMKIARESHRPKKDNRLDLAGYAWVIDQVHEERDRRKACQELANLEQDLKYEHA
jgi:hypothetical protein